MAIFAGIIKNYNALAIGTHPFVKGDNLTVTER